MKFTIVKDKSIPETAKRNKPSHPYNKLQKMIRDFVKTEEECAELDWKQAGYKNALNCYKVVWVACKASPENVSVSKCGEHVYIYKS